MATGAEQAFDELEIEEVISWCEKELAGVDLGDLRLDRRVVDTAAKMAAQPVAPINQACEDWADTKGSYRLFQNKKVSPDKILLPHQARTQERLASYERVLAVQDTTYLDYTAHPKTKGLGPIGTEQQDLRGLIMHTTLAVTAEGLALGVLTEDIWARPDKPTNLSKAERQQRPIEEKESYKWLTALRESVALTPPDVALVSVCDREADVYELFVEAADLETGLLVRATQDRLLMPPQVGKLWTRVAKTPVAGHLQVQVPARAGEPARTAIVTVQFRSVTLKPPWRPKRTDRDRLPKVRLDAVLVQEANPPAAVTHLVWLLLTNVPVTRFEQAVERIQWYRCRWHIEVFFKVLKSGCQVEACRLATAERLIRYLTLSSIVAWRLCWLTHISRQAPESPCTVVLADHEWRALYASIHHTTAPPHTTPTVGQVVRWIAQLGGFLGRKADADPGPTVIWRGWQRLNDLAAIWRLCHPPSMHPTYG